MTAADHHVLIEFCCPICLRSIRSPDTGPRPRCPRCLIRMTPDSSEPPWRSPTRRVMAVGKAGMPARKPLQEPGFAEKKKGQ